ncbi:MAG: ABC transporter permease [Spirochaetia bacterium]
MNNIPETIPAKVPILVARVLSVWMRHFQVYKKNIISNGFPPFIEPLIFLAGIGLGLGSYVGSIDNVPYLTFLASGIIIPPSMFTAAFECSFGTFIRLEFDKVYDGMISSSITVEDLFAGEMLFAATKSLFFASAVLLVVTLFGLIPSPVAVFAPLVGFLTGLMFASLSLFITSFVTTINHFNFYFTGLLTPMFFFSGIVFPLSNLPEAIRPAAEIFPLTHSVRLVRAFCLNSFSWNLLFDLGYIAVFILVFGFFAIKRLKKRLIR